MAKPLSTMTGAVWARARILSTKLEPEEKTRFLELCKSQDVTPSTLLRRIVLATLSEVEK